MLADARFYTLSHLEPKQKLHNSSDLFEGYGLLAKRIACWLDYKY
jgi:hypothetical protein